MRPGTVRSDAVKIGQFLQRHCTTRLGVRHIVDHVTTIESAPVTTCWLVMIIPSLVTRKPEP